MSTSANAYYSNSHKDFPKSGEALGQTRASAAHNSEIVYESRYNNVRVAEDICRPHFKVFQQALALRELSIISQRCGFHYKQTYRSGNFTNVYDLPRADA
jgi:hypothetical protein